MKDHITDFKLYTMKITSLIAKHIKEVFDGTNWTEIGIADTVADLTFEEATTATQASRNTIASLVYHVKFYNDVVLQRLHGVSPHINDANGFDMPELKIEGEWKQLIADAHQSFERLAAAAENFPEDRLEELTPNGESSYYKNMHGIAEHAHYHLGQMVILKKLIRS